MKTVTNLQYQIENTGLKVFRGRFAKLLHGARRGGHLRIVRPHFRGNLGAFAGAKRIHLLQGLAQRVQYSGLGALRRARFSGVGQHAWNAKRGVQIGLRIQTVRCGLFAKDAEILGQKLAIERRSGVPVRASLGQRDTHLDMAARDVALHQCADATLERIRGGSRLDVQIERAMVQALDADHHFTVAQRAAHAREAGHAAKRSRHKIYPLWMSSGGVGLSSPPPAFSRRSKATALLCRKVPGASRN
jgi:hypothetical protein